METGSAEQDQGHSALLCCVQPVSSFSLCFEVCIYVRDRMFTGGIALERQGQQRKVLEPGKGQAQGWPSQRLISPQSVGLSSLSGVGPASPVSVDSGRGPVRGRCDSDRAPCLRPVATRLWHSLGFFF